MVGANVGAFGILWFLKFLILNRLFAHIADVEAGEEAEEINEQSAPAVTGADYGAEG